MFQFRANKRRTKTLVVRKINSALCVGQQNRTRKLWVTSSVRNRPSRHFELADFHVNTDQPYSSNEKKESTFQSMKHPHKNASNPKAQTVKKAIEQKQLGEQILVTQ